MFLYPQSLRLLTVPALAAALAGCASVPNLSERPEPRGAESIAAARSLSPDASADWPSETWWRESRDPQLVALIEEGLANSPDVAVAVARYRRAAGAAQETGAARLPSLDARASVGVTKQSYNNGIPAEFLPQGWQDNGEIAASFNFDLDLWGRNRAALAAAVSERRAAEIEARQARLMLATGIASAYADLARLFEERDIRQAELDARAAEQRLIADRQANGLETRGSVRQSDAEAANARLALNAADEAIAIRRHQIAALAGAGPDRGLSIQRPSLPTALPEGVPEDVTTALLGRRPDLAAARARVEAAGNRIDVARADFFPAVRLSALVGLQSLGIGQLVDSGSTFGNAGPALSLPIFRGGALQGRYRVSRADYEAAVADYDRAVLRAYQQVADAVTRSRKIGERQADARAALSASEDAYAVARARYEGGLSTYLDVLTVQDRLLQTRLTASNLDAAARAASIDLISALGGGYQAASPVAIKDLPNG